MVTAGNLLIGNMFTNNKKRIKTNDIMPKDKAIKGYFLCLAQTKGLNHPDKTTPLRLSVLESHKALAINKGFTTSMVDRHKYG